MKAEYHNINIVILSILYNIYVVLFFIGQNVQLSEFKEVSL